jgi:hypothetical protein
LDGAGVAELAEAGPLGPPVDPPLLQESAARESSNLLARTVAALTFSPEGVMVPSRDSRKLSSHRQSFEATLSSVTSRETDAKTRAGYITLAAVNPADKRPWSAYLSLEKHDDILRFRSEGQIAEMDELVPAALLNPCSIWFGIRDDDGEGFCYSLRAPCAFRRDGTQRPAHKDELFLVFVNNDGVVLNWYWDDVDPRMPDSPIGSSATGKNKRFKEQMQ